MYLNIQGFTSNVGQLEYLINQQKPIIVCLAETHISDDIGANELHILGYKYTSTNSQSRHTGGTIIYVKEEYNFKTIFNEAIHKNVWVTGIEMKINKQLTYIFTVYHSPNSSHSDFLSKLEDILAEWAIKKGNLIVIGDFNINLAKDSYYSKKLQGLISRMGLNQLVDGFTRITQQHNTMIDLLITNRKNLQVDVHLTPKISDHSIITVTFDGSAKLKTQKKQIRDFNNFNSLDFQFNIFEQEWNSNVNNVNMLSDQLVDSISMSLERHAPLKEVTKKVKWTNNQWFSNEIKTAITERDTQFKRAVLTQQENDWQKYKLLRNKVVATVRKAKLKYYTEKIECNENNTTEMWKTIKQLVNTTNSRITVGVDFEGRLYTDDIDIAENFNTYFLASIEDIAHSCNKTALMSIILDNIEQPEVPFKSFQLTNMSQLNRIVRNLQNKKSSTDGINTEILKLCFEIVGNRFLDVINQSLSSGVFPTKWKKSLIIPIEKVANTRKCGEFRPVNMVPSYEKLLELVVYEQLVNYVERNNLLTEFQSGFRKNNSCESAIQSALVNWKAAVNSKKLVGVVLLDFKRAFETIDRKLLLLKLEAMGFKGTVLKWFGDYLSDRWQEVKFGAKVSCAKKTVHGVPQGTVLGPILFILYVNDIFKYVNRCKIQLFADDTLLYVVGNDIKEVTEAINDDLLVLQDWFSNHNLKINIKKTKFMIFKNKYVQNCTDQNGYNVYINGEKIGKVTESKYLGIILDEHLSFSSHADYVTKKVAKKVNMLGRISHNLTYFSKLLIYQTIIAPHFNYCSTILFLLSKSELDTLQKKQNQAMRIILRASRYTSISSMLQQLNILSVRQTVILDSLTFVFKMLHNLLPLHLLDHCRFVADIHNYNTRSSDDLYVSTVHSNYAQNDLFHKGLVMYNNLPRTMRECLNVREFKRQCREYVRGAVGI